MNNLKKLCSVVLLIALIMTSAVSLAADFPAPGKITGSNVVAYKEEGGQAVEDPSVTLATGQSVTVNSMDAHWALVTVPGVSYTVYVLSPNVTLDTPDPQPPAEDEDNQSTANAGKEVQVTAGSAEVYKRRVAYNPELVKSYSNGTILTLLSSGTKWAKVRDSGGTEGYTLNTNLNFNYTPPAPAEDEDNQKPAASGARVRVKSSSGATMYKTRGTTSPIAQYASGTVFTLVSRGDRWSKVKDTQYSLEGYIKNSDLEDYVDPPGEISMYVSLSSSTETLPMYRQDGGTGGVIAYYKHGTQVTVVTYGTNWTKVKVGGAEGYMQTKFLSYTKPSDNPNPPPTGSFVYATVGNQKAGAHLNLREEPNTNSSSLGQYKNGKIVKVYDRGPTWCRVEVDGIYGYMMTQFLIFDGGSENPDPGGTVQYAVVGNQRAGERLNLREGPGVSYRSIGKYLNGVSVRVYERNSNWCRVEVEGKYGYMMTSFLIFGGTPSPGPNPGNYEIYYVRNPSPTQVLNLRPRPVSGGVSLGQYRNGVVVKVFSISNGWGTVEVEGKTGYMMMQYLSRTNPGTGSIPTRAVVANPVSTQRLHLRSFASTEAKSLGLYRNGTSVTILKYEPTWCYVQVGSIKGYMMTKYLDFIG